MFINEKEQVLYVGCEAFCSECGRKVTSIVCDYAGFDAFLICAVCLYVEQRRATIKAEKVLTNVG